MGQTRDGTISLATGANTLTSAPDTDSTESPDIGDAGRVLIVVQNLPILIDHRTWQECQALRNQGYQVAVICPRGPGQRRHQIVDGVSIWTYRGAPRTQGVLSYVFEFGYCWVRTAVLSVAVARRHGFDVIQACNPPDTYWALALFYKPFGKKFVFDHHDLCPELYRSRFGKDGGLLLRALLLLERMNQRVADHVIVTNESYRRLALTRGRLPSERVTVVRNGPDPELMKPAAERPELRRGRQHLACYLGIMGPQDGVDRLLDAIHHYVHVLGRTDCAFALLGFGDCLDDLRKQSSRLGLDDWVEFTGRADDQMIRDYLSTATVGLSPDPRSPLNEVSTMSKTLEYMAYALPVVAYDLTETRVSAEDAAVYVPSDTVADFARTLAELLTDPDRRRTLGARGRERIVNELSWRYSEPRYVGVHDRLRGRQAGHPSIPVPRQGGLTRVSGSAAPVHATGSRERAER
ncbi:glycosyltransferase [Frankia casuarinae]|uniref:Glycosyl transferase, group 1 n=1 Tax=Frankia casuarinae (strain DSM 45818 / CECT 9043 / HFP020203 / CcI3) TaxID=106370 RepID=Q2JCQ4_FRACC|nr:MULTISPECIES: glycosyltransferase family 4 protein [Frankia]ABD10938.1 glycosyl transferase, group 1 [Frankia casuarinae]ETA02209.1 glycosyltransferase [Frankia sp. CcI6]EYT92375.1 glycosyltransferase [Frankia casuarinae]KDA42892.1 glycosyltransferase [Frankia sp. BMG5.23]KEZ37543.1 glycosyltransferase [Frankia sp. CeD]